MPPRTSRMVDPLDPASGELRLVAGTMVGEYRVEAQLGEGGMGIVYAAVHPVIGKKVAIKVLSALVTREPTALDRFALEARAVNAIAHPNIVDIFSFGRLPDGRHYFVMERLEGETLAARIARAGPLSAVEALPPFRGVGRALAAAHRSQIVHRDLKPDNIMLAPREDGTLSAKLLDFGVAKLLEPGMSAGSTVPKTRAGTVVGTPQYMAPEQCLGGAVDPRTDLYALGVVLFETLTGRWPFEGATVVEIWQGHVGKPPPPLGDALPAGAPTSPELEALVAQLLAKSPAHRLQSAAQFCEALDAVAPTLGAARARKDRPPRLDAPLVQPPQSLLMTSPGGLKAPSPEELARLAAAFEVRLTDVVTLDGVAPLASGSRQPAPPAAPMPAPPTPTLDLDVTTDLAGPEVPLPAAEPVLAPAAEAARYAPPAAPEVALELGLEPRATPSPARRAPTRPARLPASPARSAPGRGSGSWLIVLMLVVLVAASAVWLLRRFL